MQIILVCFAKMDMLTIGQMYVTSVQISLLVVTNVIMEVGKLVIKKTFPPDGKKELTKQSLTN